jgi:hypothetical protein
MQIWVRAELATVDLGDARLGERLVKLGDQLRDSNKISKAGKVFRDIFS